LPRRRARGPEIRPRAPAELLLAARALDSLRDRALREDAAEVRLVLDRSLKVGLDVHTFRGLLGGGLDRRHVEFLADEPRLDALGAYRLRAGARDSHARLRALAFLVERHHRGDADDSEARGGVRELQVGAAAARRPRDRKST